jgi:hypothetical protein
MSEPAWRRRLAGPVAASAVLLVFWIALIASLRDKSLTSDEPVHAAAGATYWRLNDYRLNPENGNLPQRWMAIPLVLGGYGFPAADSAAWRVADEWTWSDEWFYHRGNDTRAMMFWGRAMSGLLAVALGALVWAWSRRIFGPAGGMLSLLLYVLDPTLLANGGLMTSDTACALFFLGAVGCLWSVFHRITAGRVLLSALVLGGLFVSKMSAILIVPIAVVLAGVRLFSGAPPRFEVGKPRPLISRRSRAGAFAVVALLHAAIAIAVIWGFYGFRYSAFAPGSAPESQFDHPWAEVLGDPTGSRPAAARILTTLRDDRLLPEAYIYGAAHAWKFSRLRSAFLNGEFSLTGWRGFFPYTFLVKTPLPLLAIVVLALGGLRRRVLYDTIPLWALLLFYWAAAIANPLNIGHRHILATYPPLFVLCGAAGPWLAALATKTGARRADRIRGGLLGVLLAALAAEMAVCFPNYLTYCNRIAGGSAQGYRHLVDSSYDWGQDLPSLKRYLAEHSPTGPVYLSYFGTASPDYYGIPARLLYSFRGQDVPPPVQLLDLPADPVQGQALVDAVVRRHPDYEIAGGASGPNGRVGLMLLRSPNALRLAAGTYFISATMLQPVMYELNGPIGPWNQRYENTYQQLYAAARPLFGDDPAARRAALAARRPTDWRLTLAYFDVFRFARLTAYLRRQEPVDAVNHSILVYQVSAADLGRALDGPPPELGPDLPMAAGLLPPP